MSIPASKYSYDSPLHKLQGLSTPALETIRARLRSQYLAPEEDLVGELVRSLALSVAERQSISDAAAALVRQVRQDSAPTMMEKFLGEYGLSSKEGIALMCMAEALLRVPDKHTIDALIEDKIQSGDWSSHIGHSDSHLINSSTWALLITGKLLAPVDSVSVGSTLRGMVKRLGEPVVRTAVAQAMKELGAQFVLGRDIQEACKRGLKRQQQGYTYSYDMLGEAARTGADAQRYFKAYSQAIAALAKEATQEDIRANPGISIKLSALHPRYEFAQRERLINELVPQVVQLAEQAKAANMGFNIDAEEADRLDLSLDVIGAVLAHEELAGWDGFGVVVQAFSKRAGAVLDWLYELSKQLDRNIMVRLVKGAYWDAEIKRAQVMGLAGFPVFTRKANTDVAYLSCARQLLAMNDRIYAQFATHNAHSVAAIRHMAAGKNYEFQRLHGMGESLHEQIMKQGGARCRIYAPVGAHEDLLAYLVRRLLENGANSSFVHQLVNPAIAPEVIAKDPLAQLQQRQLQQLPLASEAIAMPAKLFGEGRANAMGWDITDVVTMNTLQQQQDSYLQQTWSAQPLIAKPVAVAGLSRTVMNPALATDAVGTVMDASPEQIQSALQQAGIGQSQWLAMPMAERLSCFAKLAELYEEHAVELFALLAREAGKTWLDAVGELREAVDFVRYYAQEMASQPQAEGRGVISCISPWNFPLAIFTGQITAALAAGNAVLAKPAPQTCLVGYRAVQLMHEAGIPVAAIQYLPGDGKVGAALTSSDQVQGVCFTGSTPTAQLINRSMADNLPTSAPLIAETGGLNAMIVDSTALPEQVVRDVLASAFQSAGQRCSALRVLYLQEDVADKILTMLYGAMDELQLGNPSLLSTDIGPVIDVVAQHKIQEHIDKHAANGNVLHQLKVPQQGLFVAPTVIRVAGIEDLEEEIFGPVLHVATYGATEQDALLASINASGYGLTFGVHTRVDGRVEALASGVKAGNIYVNRNQIGAVVGSQPFGGEGLSGTGPKAGGPQYVQRLRKPLAVSSGGLVGVACELAPLQAALDKLQQLDATQWQVNSQRTTALAQVFGAATEVVEDVCRDKQLLPGPTGELNQLTTGPRGVVICLGPGRKQALDQARIALAQGNKVLLVAADISLPEHGLPLVMVSGYMPANWLTKLHGFDGVACNGEEHYLRQLRIALAAREGALLPLITETKDAQRYTHERHLCIDTTAAGGNASLIAAGE